MIEHSLAYDAAITGDHRKIVPLVAFDLIDPDYKFESWETNDASAYGFPDQAVARANVDDDFEQTIGSLELNRWRLDGSITIEPDDKNDRLGHVGWESSSICDSSGHFAVPPWLEINFSGVSIIQVMTVKFFDKELEGIGEDFTIQFWSGNSLIETVEVTGNEDVTCIVEGFTVHYPTRIRLTIRKWSRGHRRVRLSQFLIGLYEDWDAKNLAGIDIYTESTFSCLNLPYSTCSVEVYNKNHRFDPYAPNTIFASIEERQAVTVKLGVRMDDGSVEYIPCGMYYQQSGGGWQLNDLTIQFNLLDVIGMLTKRNFIVPDALPTTLKGWIAAVVACMGENQADRYRVDDDVADLPLAAEAEDVTGQTCGSILRFACMATNTWPHQDMKTGHLWVSKISFVEGNKITLDNMSSYPVMSENSQIADITFQLDKDSNGKVQTVTFPGTNTESEVSLNVNNPFIHTADDARKALVSCMFEYGGKSFQVTHRGNPTSETGDIQSVDTQFGTAISARLYKQQLKLQDGVMRNLPSFLVQSPNDSIYEHKELLTGSGTWTATKTGTIKITVIGGGTGGQGGGGGIEVISGGASLGGSQSSIGNGNPGSGGKVFIIEFGVVAGQKISYSCGLGGAGGAGGAVGQKGSPGNPGGNTLFGSFSSEHGTVYPNGIMDVQSGAVYAQTGAESGSTVSGSYGTGGNGGAQGENGLWVVYKEPVVSGPVTYWGYQAKRPEPGLPGRQGKPGCVIVEW